MFEFLRKKGANKIFFSLLPVFVISNFSLVYKEFLLLKKLSSLWIVKSGTKQSAGTVLKYVQYIYIYI